MELWRINFTKNGAVVLVASASDADGLLFETDGPDIFGRAMDVGLVGANDAFDRLLGEYFEEQAVPADSPSIRVEAGMLVFDYAVTKPLPLGSYRLTCQVTGLRLPANVLVATDGVSPPAATLEIQPTKHVALTVPDLTRWDADIQGLIRNRTSTADGRPLWDWLSDSTIDDQRRACALNIIAKLRCTPSPTNPLIRSVQQIVGVLLDRVYARMDPGLTTVPSGLLLTGFNHEGRPVDAGHQKLIQWVGSRLNEQRMLDLDSYRQDVTFTSLQVVYAGPRITDASANPNLPLNYYGDIDIDLGGSLTDVVGFVVHMSELQGDTVITDHLALHDELLKHDSLTKQYMYYDAE